MLPESPGAKTGAPRPDGLTAITGIQGRIMGRRYRAPFTGVGRVYLFPRGLLIACLALAGCESKPSGERVAAPPREEKAAKSVAPKHEQVGEASWYGPGFEGKQTASGDTFKKDEMTAASPHLPLGSKAEVTNLESGKKVQVEITDRGPYAKGRAIDLSEGAAKKLGITKQGTAPVKIKLKSRPAGPRHVHHKKHGIRHKKSSKKRASGQGRPGRPAQPYGYRRRGKRLVAGCHGKRPGLGTCAQFRHRLASD